MMTCLFISCSYSVTNDLTPAGLNEIIILVASFYSDTKSLIHISRKPQYRVHREQVHNKGLDLVFRSLEQGDEGEYICVQTKNPESRVQFDLVVVQPIDYGDTSSTQMVKV